MNTPMAILGLSVLLASCGGSAPPTEAPSRPATTAPAAAPPPSGAPEAQPASASSRIEAKLEARSGSQLTGKAVLEATKDGVKVTVEVSGVSKGAHGVHVHDKGDCSSPDGASAGPHFNPGGHEHGLPPVAARHLGDLGNLEVGDSGDGKLEITVAGANLEPDHPHSFLGRAIIVHEKQDDGGQPAGNAGGRIGCGVIRR